MNQAATRTCVFIFLFTLVSLTKQIAFAEADNFVVIDGEVYLESYINAHPSIFDRSTATTTKVLTKSNSDRFFDIFSTYESFKEESAIWTRSQQGRKTLTKMKYVVCPIWFADEAEIPANKTKMNTVLQATKEYYERMSWNQNEVTWEFLEDLKLVNVTKSQNATRNVGSNACLQHMKLLGYVYPLNYTGVIVAYNPTATGEFSFRGGYGVINGNVIWNSLEFGYSVHRHEVGHNYGHPHHSAYTYDARVNRTATTSVADGFDMMSGGNGAVEAHITAASKYFFNWMTPDSVITMHPDGPSTSCSWCMNSINKVVLKPFDRFDIIPSESNLMAVHIPVLGVGSTATFSYWLSYRSNYTESRNGLSMHLVRLNLGSMFGATFDSLNFDAVGTTSTTKDSFILKDTCYIINPPGILMDFDPASVEKTQPVVCVDDIDKGESITISVSFLKKDAPKIPFEMQAPLTCNRMESKSDQTALDMTKNKVHLIELTGTGQDGNLTFSICQESTTGSVTAYFYDSYPSAYLSYNAPPSYGALYNVTASTSCPNSISTLYETEYGQTFVLVIADDKVTSDTIVRFSAKCKVGTCHVGQFMDDSAGVCSNCPEGSISATGSIGSDSCISCLSDGFEPLGTKSNDCKVSLRANPALNTGESWRVIVPLEHSSTKFGNLRVDEIEFYASRDCRPESKISTAGGVAFASSNQVDAQKAFNSVPGFWRGGTDSRGLFYLGLNLTRAITVNCIIYKQPSLDVKELRVQTKSTGEANWKNVWIVPYLPNTTNVIPFVAIPTSAPTTIPTVPPTQLPTRASNTKTPTTISPADIPTNISPVGTPTTINAPISTPTEEVENDVCISPDNKCRGGLFRFFRSGETMHRTFLGTCRERCSTFSFGRGLTTLFGWKCGPCPEE